MKFSLCNVRFFLFLHLCQEYIATTTTTILVIIIFTKVVYYFVCEVKDFKKIEYHYSLRFSSAMFCPLILYQFICNVAAGNLVKIAKF